MAGGTFDHVIRWDKWTFTVMGRVLIRDFLH